MKPVVIIGAGGFARETLDVIEAVNQESPQYDMLGYIVDPEYGSPGALINDKPILGGFDWLSLHNYQVSVICGVGPSHYRHRLIRRAEEAGCRFFSVVHPTSQLTRWVEFGQGVVIAAGCILTNRIRIGAHVHLNLACTIGHDVDIANFATLAPGVHVSGNVELGQGCYVGTGANIIEKLKIGEWSIVGAGSTVVKNVPANTTVVGIPAKVIKEHEGGWHLH
jgi:sugar O-acyltransferase (sialic acid O-acetyltransferase NeuD family)